MWRYSSIWQGSAVPEIKCQNFLHSLTGAPIQHPDISCNSLLKKASLISGLTLAKQLHDLELGWVLENLRMKAIFKPLLGVLVGAGGLAWGVVAEAALNWSTTNLPGNKTYSATDGSTTVTTTVSGWADVPQGTTLDDVSSSIASYGSYGLGIDRSGEYTPNHAVDADGPDEALGFTFSDKVALSSLTVGWAEEWQDLYPQGYSSYSNRTWPNTADLRVLAWVGSDAPPRPRRWSS
jgi:hypothetical protein